MNNVSFQKKTFLYVIFILHLKISHSIITDRRYYIKAIRLIFVGSCNRKSLEKENRSQLWSFP